MASTSQGCTFKGCHQCRMHIEDVINAGCASRVSSLQDTPQERHHCRMLLKEVTNAGYTLRMLSMQGAPSGDC
eukprot:1148881-Pelagomonas_calceolata.AAC.10